MDYDTSQVVDPVTHLQNEIESINSIIGDIEGQMLKLVVQRKQMEVSRDALVAGLKSVHNADPKPVLIPLKS